MSNARIRKKRAKKCADLFLLFFGKLNDKEARKIANKYNVKYERREFTGLADRYKELTNGRKE